MNRLNVKKVFLVILMGMFFLGFSGALWAQDLEIHYINVEQGQGILIIGPSGATILFDGGTTGKGTAEVVPYLQSQGITTSQALDYIITSHLDTDHFEGLTEVMNYGYDALHVYDNGSNKTNTYITAFHTAASGTTAGGVTSITLGQVINLGSGATARCVAANGSVIGVGAISGGQANENDRSVVLLVKYGNFEFITTGDLGGGSDDGACTGRSTSQVNIETPLVNAIMPGGAYPLLSSYGVEVAHIGHHGSESSGNSDYMNNLSPQVACISVGAGQSSGWYHPRIDVVEHVFLAQSACITAPPALVLQTEEGSPAGSTTSYAGYCVGDIVIATDGVSYYTVTANGAVTQGPDERNAAGLPAVFYFEEGGGGTITANFSGTPTSGTAPLNVSFTDLTSGATSWSWTFGDGGTSTSQNPSHTYTAAGTYTVSLTAANAYGSDTETKTGYITVSGSPQPPVAAFTGSPTSVSVGGSVAFTDQSTNTPTSWSWTFAGGAPATSAVKNPTVTYNTAGTYNVTLTATNAYGNNTLTKTNYITVTAGSYCTSQSGGPSNEWIARVKVGTTLNNSSGASAYTDFTSLTANLPSVGQSVTFELVPGFSGSSYTEYWKVWIDFNRDSDFLDSNEQVYSGSGTTMRSGSFTIPSVATNGNTRMRVSMKYGSAPTSCETFSYGEVEDYTANIGGVGVTYCTSSGGSQADEWIGRVRIGALDKSSGASAYSDYTSIVTNYTRGASQSVTLTPAFSGSAYSEYWVVWIDYNKDGDFTDSGESVFSKSGTSAVTGTFTVSSSASTGNTRMRVTMKYGSTPSSCGTFSYGEVEDYTANIL
jgi:PKD repeat protein/beta-lactamase superfamily II metal-dependent hydrolase